MFATLQDKLSISGGLMVLKAIRPALRARFYILVSLALALASGTSLAANAASPVDTTDPGGLKVFYRRTAGRITGIDVQEPTSRSGKTSPVVPFVSDLTHTALGQPKSWRWANGDTASRTFDTDGRMTQSEIASCNYDAASRITGIT